jgi:nucleotide-binding universal stress UspA family protein
VRVAGELLEGELRRGEPAAVIADVAESANVSLLVLGTHGRTGTNAFWRDSTGAKVVAQTRRPLLLVPVKPA